MRTPDGWQKNPDNGLREYPNGTRFMLRKDEQSPEAEYELVANMAGDKNWRAQPVGGLSSEVFHLSRRRKWQFKLCSDRRPVLLAHWNHHDRVIFCGTFRVAKADFSTNPPPEFCAQVLDDICAAMNAWVGSTVDSAQEKSTKVQEPRKMKKAREMLKRKVLELRRSNKSVSPARTIAECLKQDLLAAGIPHEDHLVVVLHILHGGHL